MGQIKTHKGSLLKKCQAALAAKGRLSTAISGFVERESQLALSEAIVKAVEDKSILVAEAGTGTGKTFAYLVPCLLSNKKVIVSTATKTLQDQLFQKDIPTLLNALGIAKQVQNLKGRANYLCLHRTHLHAEEGRFVKPQIAQEVISIREKLARLKEGDRAELVDVCEDSLVWPYVTSSVDNCLGNKCEYYQKCFLVKARKKALAADIVVINHHVFFADACLKEEGFGELLPGVEVVVFDEAHQLTEIAENFHGKRISTRQLRELITELLQVWPTLDLANRPLKPLSLDLDQIIEQLLSLFPEEKERLGWEIVAKNKVFMQAWQALITLINTFLDCIEEAELKDEKIQNCAKQLKEYKTLAALFEPKPNKSFIFWLERFKHNLVLHATPIEIGAIFSEQLSRKPGTYIFTSATLSTASCFDTFTKPLGLKEANNLLLPSPFNYKEQALLYLPRGLPDPKQDNYYEALLNKALPVINACGGRTFFLFTSHKALKLVAQYLSHNLKYPLLIQGTEAKPLLLARFRQLGNAVLLGTATFWEGVDVKGDALSCVIIDKLPFTSPSDPIMQGKMAYLKSQGLSGFDELALPQAILALKQGVGRLIRDMSDKGILMIADPRLTSREYGRLIFASLPGLRKTREEEKVLDFIKERLNIPRELALENETISH